MSKAQKRALQARLQAKLNGASHSAEPYGDRATPYRDVALDVATFALDDDPLRETDNIVYRPAKIFHAGNYPDKNFSLTPSELMDAATKFSDPISIDLEHVQTPLDGNLGRLVAVEPSDNGSVLNGLIAYPKWLHSILPNPSLSATWDRASKALVGLALVRNPRVPDAALFAAFSVDQAVRGKATLADVSDFIAAFDDSSDDDDDDDDKDGKKDDSPRGKFLAMLKAKRKGKKGKGAKFGYDGMVATGGAAAQSGGALDDDDDDDEDDDDDDTAEKDDKSSKFAVNRKSVLAQVVHDVSVQRGAVCRVEPQPGRMTPYGIVKFAKGMAALQTIHDTSLKMGAACLYGQRDTTGGGPWQWEWPGVTSDGRKEVGGNKPPHFSTNRGGSKDMGDKLGRRLAAFLAELDDDEDARIPGAHDYAKGADSQAGFREGDSERHLRERNAALEDENRRMRQQGIYDRAVSFADKLINVERRAMPVEREAIIKVHMQAGNDDTFVGTASFSDGQSRVSQLESAYMSRPKHLMDVEAAGEAMATATALFNQMKTATTNTAAGDGPMTAERRAHLLSLDTVGKQVLADEKKNGSGGNAATRRN